MLSLAATRILDFGKRESSPGLVLMCAALLALVISNSAFASGYAAFLAVPIAVQIGALEIAKPLVLWVNDGLMAIFFFLVGLEIKREVIAGQLSTIDRAALPLIAAVGGMAIPALVFVAINWNYPENLNGWAVPAATDIAFALGILALMGTRAPAALKLLLLAIAIIDDLGAIIIIAIFYTEQMSVFSLLFGALGFGVLMLFNRMGITRMGPYLVVGLIIWVAVLKSGVHATLAGVMIAMTIPFTGRNAQGETVSPLDSTEHALAPWVAFAVLPLFAFANAGVPLTGITFADMLAPLPLGVAAGLFIGKQIGVFGFARLGVAMGWCRLPDGMSWLQLYGVACLTGIGFTMSLFIGTLAFDTTAQLDAVRLGVLTGSTLSGILGVICLYLCSSTDKKTTFVEAHAADRKDH